LREHPGVPLLISIRSSADLKSLKVGFIADTVLILAPVSGLFP
jgi:hypothetical protein